jgi:type IV secretory pathway component VirB8
MEQENVIKFKTLEEKSSHRKFKSIKNKRNQTNTNTNTNTEDKTSNISNTNDSATNGPVIIANNSKRKILWSIAGIVVLLGIIAAIIIILVNESKKNI